LQIIHFVNLTDSGLHCFVHDPEKLPSDFRDWRRVEAAEANSWMDHHLLATTIARDGHYQSRIRMTRITSRS
jgi:hypothetical protein